MSVVPLRVQKRIAYLIKFKFIEFASKLNALQSILCRFILCTLKLSNDRILLTNQKATLGLDTIVCCGAFFVSRIQSLEFIDLRLKLEFTLPSELFYFFWSVVYSLRGTRAEKALERGTYGFRSLNSPSH